MQILDGCIIVRLLDTAKYNYKVPILFNIKDGGGYASKNGPIYKSIQNLH